MMFPTAPSSQRRSVVDRRAAWTILTFGLPVPKESTACRHPNVSLEDIIAIFNKRIRLHLGSPRSTMIRPTLFSAF